MIFLTTTTIKNPAKTISVDIDYHVTTSGEFQSIVPEILDKDFDINVVYSHESYCKVNKDGKKVMCAPTLKALDFVFNVAIKHRN